MKYHTVFIYFLFISLLAFVFVDVAFLCIDETNKLHISTKKLIRSF